MNFSENSLRSLKNWLSRPYSLRSFLSCQRLAPIFESCAISFLSCSVTAASTTPPPRIKFRTKVGILSWPASLARALTFFSSWSEKEISIRFGRLFDPWRFVVFAFCSMAVKIPGAERGPVFFPLARGDVVPSLRAPFFVSAANKKARFRKSLVGIEGRFFPGCPPGKTTPCHTHYRQR